jgi:hypothetical protein
MFLENSDNVNTMNCSCPLPCHRKTYTPVLSYAHLAKVNGLAKALMSYNNGEVEFEQFMY